MGVDVGGRGSTEGLRRAVTPSKPKATSRTKPRVSAVRTTRSTRSSGSGSSGGSSSRNYNRSSSRRSTGGGGGGGSSPSTPVKKPPVPPSIADYLGMDSSYQQAVRGGKRSLTDFLSELGRRKGEAGTQYTQTQASMERDRVQQLDALRQEFASRGLIQSGLFGEEQGRFQEQFLQQKTALDQQQAALLADLLSQEKNYRRENDLAMEQAKQEALLRRAQKYKIGA